MGETWFPPRTRAEGERCSEASAYPAGQTSSRPVGASLPRPLRRPSKIPRVASARARLLGHPLPAGRDLGCLLPLHRGRRPRHPAGRADVPPPVARRGPAGRIHGVSPGGPSHARGAAGRLANVPRARGDQRRAADDPRRLGADAHRLEHRGDRAGLGSDLRRPPEPPVPATRAHRPVWRGRPRPRDLRRRAHHRRERGGRLVGGGRNTRGRRLVALLCGRRRVRAAEGAQHARARARHRLDARRRARAAALRGRGSAHGGTRHVRGPRPPRSGALPDLRRPAAPVPHAPALRERPHVPRHVSHAGLRSRVRRRATRRAR